MEEDTTLLTREGPNISKSHMQLHLYAILRKKLYESDLVALTPTFSNGVQDRYYQQQLTMFCFIFHEK